MGEWILRIPLGIESGSRQRPLEIVEDRHHLANRFSFPPSARRLNLTRHPLAEVLEVGLGPLGKVEVLISLPASVSEKLIQIALDFISVIRPSCG